ncbi:MAG: hypothetical protein ACRDRL_12900, partial [Sciscionella sp.]
MATKNATKTRKQVTDAVDSVFDTARTPFLAVLGAGDLASQTVLDVLNKAKAQVDRSTSTPGTPADLRTLRARLDEVELRKLIDPNELRKLVDPSELRNVLD